MEPDIDPRPDDGVEGNIENEQHCLCDDCLFGYQHCPSTSFPRATECPDFINRYGRFFTPRGTKPGLEARNYMTNTADLAARGQIDPYGEGHATSHAPEVCPKCGRSGHLYTKQEWSNSRQDYVTRKGCSYCDAPNKTKEERRRSASDLSLWGEVLGWLRKVFGI
jgi:hypothetical protein